MKRKHSSPPRSTSQHKRLTEQSVQENPFDQFNQWFTSAVERKIPKVNAMALATASSDGIPSVRIVLLKGVDDRGFSFYTNTESKKGKQLAENLNAALLFFWPQCDRQIRIEGTVEKLSGEESYEYFRTRPRKSRIGAWASRQSEVIENRAFLEMKFGEYQKRFLNKEVPLPDNWRGYRLLPRYFEFWQERPNRLHDRIAYLNVDTRWKIVRLSP